MWTDGKGKKGKKWRERAMEEDRIRSEGPTEGEKKTGRERASEGESQVREMGRERKEFVCAATAWQM